MPHKEELIVRNIVLNKISENMAVRVVLFLMCFTLAAPVFNALNSIVTALAALAAIYLVYRHRTLGLREVPLSLYSAMAVFFVAIAAASVAIGDAKSISYSVRTLYWFIPFFLLFILDWAGGENGFEDNSVTVFYAYGLALFVSSAATVHQFWTANVPRLTGIYGHPNHYASMLDIILPVCTVLLLKYFLEKRDWLLVVLLLMNVLLGYATLIRTASRGAICGIVVGLILTLILYAIKTRAKKILLVALVIALGCAPVYYLNASFFERNHTAQIETILPYDKGRVAFLEASYHMWEDHKVFGVGLANWHENYKYKYLPEGAPDKFDMPHNMYAYYFSTAGTLGGVGFLLFILAFFFCFYKNMLPFARGGYLPFAMMWAFLAFCLHGAFDIGITNKLVARLFFATSGLLVCESVKLKHREHR